MNQQQNDLIATLESQNQALKITVNELIENNISLKAAIINLNKKMRGMREMDTSENSTIVS